LSAEELADPAVFDRRRRAAAELLAGGNIRPDRAGRYRVDYLTDGPRLPPGGDRVRTADLPPWISRPFWAVECPAEKPEDDR